MNVIRKIRKKTKALKDIINEEIEKQVTLLDYIKMLQKSDPEVLMIKTKNSWSKVEKHVFKAKSIIESTAYDIGKIINANKQFLIDAKSLIDCAMFFIEKDIKHEQLKDIVNAAIEKEKEKLLKLEETTDYSGMKVKGSAVTKRAMEACEKYKTENSNEIEEKKTKITEKPVCVQEEEFQDLKLSEKKTEKQDDLDETKILKLVRDARGLGDKEKHYSNVDNTIDDYIQKNEKLTVSLYKKGKEELVNEVLRLYIDDKKYEENQLKEAKEKYPAVVNRLKVHSKPYLVREVCRLYACPNKRNQIEVYHQQALKRMETKKTQSIAM